MKLSDQLSSEVMGKRRKLFGLTLCLLSQCLIVQSNASKQTTLQIEVTTGLEQVSNATTLLVPHSVTSDADVVTTTTVKSSTSPTATPSTPIVSPSVTTYSGSISSKGTTTAYVSSTSHKTRTSHNTATRPATATYKYSDTTEKKDPVWSVPFIALVGVAAILLLVCIVCVIVICRLKRSLKKRSRLYPGVILEDDDHHYMDLGDHPLRETVAVELKSVVEHKDGETEYINIKRSLKKRSRLYPGVIPEDDDHHYMDLGDHPLRETVAVELKSVVEHKDGETDLTEVDDKPTMKSYKERKRKPPPPLPAPDIPNAEEKGQLTTNKGPIVERHSKSNSKKNKRQDSMKKYMTPNYNNTNPLDLTDDDDINLYESYDHSDQNLSSYCLEMIEDGLTHSEDSDASNNHIQDDKRRSSSDKESPVQLRKNSDPENGEHDGLKFTERQISTSGLPETIVQYSINQQTAECPLNVKDSGAYGNNASHNDSEIDSPMVSDLHISNFPDNDMKTGHSNADKEKRGMITLPEHENDSQTQSFAVYDDDFIPDSVCLEIDKNSTFLTNSENTASENQSTQEFGNTNTSFSTAIYDDAFIPVTNYDENGNIDAPPLYEDTVNCPLVTGEVYDDSLVSFDSTLIKDSADILPLYEDTDENAKLTLGISVNATGNSNTNVTATVATQENGPVYKGGEVVSNGDTNINDLDVYEDYDMGKLSASNPPPISKELNTILAQPNFGSSLTDDKNSADLVFNVDIRNDLTSMCHHSQMVQTSTSEPPGTSNVQPQNMNVNTLRLLDLSLEPEKVQSGSKIDIFDEPSMKDSPEKYFVDMKDFTSEIVDNINKDISPVIDEEKSFTIINDSNITSTHITSDTLAINAFESNVDSEHKTASNNNKVKQTQNFDTVWDQTVQIDHNMAGKTVNCVDLSDVKNSDLLTYDNLTGLEVTKNMDDQETTKAVNGDNFSDNESEIYDTPPPNFPPPQLQW